MCQILEREGREWACESIQQLQRLAGKGDDWQQLINYLERGTKNRPAAFVRGVQGVIDEMRVAVGRAARPAPTSGVHLYSNTKCSKRRQADRRTINE